MAALILAGEAIFIPPFHPGRYFKSTLLETLRIDELQLGQAQAWYGIVAMACYVLGGPIADRFAPRTLLAGSLVATGFGSVYLASSPTLFGLKLLFAFWGASTILAFWAPLIRATREWGGDATQGRAFGVLDGGRGLVAAVVAQASAIAVAGQLSAGADSAAGAFRGIALSYAVVCWVIAAIVWFAVPVAKIDREDAGERGAAGHVLDTLRMPAVWLQAIVVITAYCAYKTFDFYGLYLEDGFGMTKEGSANLLAWISYLRVGAAVGAGFVADRWLNASGTVAACFVTLVAGYAAFLALPPTASLVGFAAGAMAITAAACFALRGVYFALLEEASIPRSLTGTAVGVVSLIGFTPDVFLPWLSGWMVTSARESGDVLVGYQRLWCFLLAMSAAGLVAATLLRRRPSAG